jgi:hypothetical protein
LHFEKTSQITVLPRSCQKNLYPNGVDPLNADSVTFSGAVPAPEPGSFALLAGLALVAGRRFLKLRKCRI